MKYGVCENFFFFFLEGLAGVGRSLFGLMGRLCCIILPVCRCADCRDAW